MLILLYLGPPSMLPVGITVPIIPGIMPLQTYSSFLRLTKLCGTHIPQSLSDALQPICVSKLGTVCGALSDILTKHDDQLIKDFGVKLAVQMIRRLTQEANVPGVHFCTLNLEKSVQTVLEQLQWTGKHLEVHNKLIEVCYQFICFPCRCAHLRIGHSSRCCACAPA